MWIDPFSDHDCQEGHEREGHRQPIPRETAVVGSEMVVRRAKRDEDHCQKKHCIYRIQRLERSRAATADSPQPGDPDDEKSYVRNHVPEIWNAQHGPLIRELVIADVLWNGFVEGKSEDGGCHNCQKEPVAPATSLSHIECS
jgi:hypothetical protein